MLADGTPSEAPNHHMHKLDKPIVKVRRLQVNVLQVHRHVDILGLPKLLVDKCLLS